MTLRHGLVVLCLALIGWTHTATDSLAVQLRRDASDNSTAIHQGERKKHIDGDGDGVLEDEGEGTVGGEFVQ